MSGCDEGVGASHDGEVKGEGEGMSGPMRALELRTMRGTR